MNICVFSHQKAPNMMGSRFYSIPFKGSKPTHHVFLCLPFNLRAVLHLTEVTWLPFLILAILDKTRHEEASQNYELNRTGVFLGN